MYIIKIGLKQQILLETLRMVLGIGAHLLIPGLWGQRQVGLSEL